MKNAVILSLAVFLILLFIQGQNAAADTTKTAALMVIKHVINDDGGTAQASDFTITVDHSSDVSVSPYSFQGSEDGTVVTLTGNFNSLAHFTVHESSPQSSNYDVSFSSDCNTYINAGEVLTCTITNDDKPVTPTTSSAPTTSPSTTQSEPNPSISISPTSGPPGTTVSVSGTGFPVFTKIDIYLLPNKITTITTDSTGSFSGVPVTIPQDASPGKKSIAADDLYGYGYYSYAIFTVTSTSTTPSSTPTSAPNVSASPSSASFTHNIGSSPCPTPITTVTLNSNLQGTWSVKSNPSWMSVTINGNQASLSFNCQLESYVTQTLNGDVEFTFTSADNQQASASVTVTGQVNGS